MRPRNTTTSPEVKFYFPDQAEAEYHTSIDIEGAPNVIHLEGDNHIVVYENTQGVYVHGKLDTKTFDLQIGTKLKLILGLGEYENNVINLTSDKETKVIVQIDQAGLLGGLEDPQFDYNGIAILPATEALPEIAGAIPDIPSQIKYRVLGFISADDRLMTWKKPGSVETLLVDWCVANALIANDTEAERLINALPADEDLIGLLSRYYTTTAYLRYFVLKHQNDDGAITYIPDHDPRDSYEIDTQTHLLRAKVGSFMASISGSQK